MGENKEGDDFDQWNISAPKHPNSIQQPPERREASATAPINPSALDEELSGWGVEMPPVITDGSENAEATQEVEMPSIIASDQEAQTPDAAATQETQTPDAAATQETQTPDAAATQEAQTPDAADTQEAEADDKTIQFEPPTKTNIDTNLLGQLDQEEGKGFWSADAGEGSPIPKSTERADPIDEGEVVQRIRDALTPIIEEVVRNYCQKNIEKVAWEVIPDLAENLIKKEIKNIANSTDD